MTIGGDAGRAAAGREARRDDRPLRPQRSARARRPLRQRRPASSAGRDGRQALADPLRAHDGRPSSAFLVLPAWYGPAANPPLPLVIISLTAAVSSGRANSILWGNLPGRGSFAVVNPDARGRRVAGHSWGYAGQIADLARMPEILRTTLPWLRIDRRKVYAFGGSMGGQETLLLRRPPSEAARRRRGVLGRDRHRAPVPELHAAPLQQRVPHAPRQEAVRCRPARAGPREIGGGPGTCRRRVRGAQPDHVCRRDRALVRPAAALVERRRPDRRRPAVADPGKFFWELRRLNPRRHGRRVRRLLDPLRRDAGAHGAAARARARSGCCPPRARGRTSAASGRCRAAPACLR